MTHEKLDNEMINVGETIDIVAVPIEITPAVQALVERLEAFEKLSDTDRTIDQHHAEELAKEAIALLVAGEPFNSEPPKGSGQAAWKDTSPMLSNGRNFYSDLITKIGELLGPEAYTSDDGSIQSSVLALKLPELVKATLDENDKLKEEIAKLKQFNGN